MKQDNNGYMCPVCGNYEFQKNGDYEICPECGWENDPVQNRDENYSGGSNKMSLKEARKSFQHHITGLFTLILAIFLLCACGGPRATEVSKSPLPAAPAEAEANSASAEPQAGTKYKFRNYKLLDSHFQKHGIEMGFSDPEAYEIAASKVAENPDSLHKTEKEDGDDVYYLEVTNEFVVVSTDGYIRTYFLPDKGKSYFDRQ